MTRALADRQVRNFRRIFCVAALLIATGPSLTAQTAPVERTFHASTAVVNSKLRRVGGYPGGKLPILDGFVVPPKDALDQYRQGYYQYSVQLTARAAGETQVRVTAKITAWYAASDQSHSGYRVLSSNGRLEADLLDRLEQELTSHSAAGDPTPAQPGHAAQRTFSLPDKPPAASTSGNTPGGSNLQLRSWHIPAQATLPGNSADEQRVQRLRDQLKNLQEILKNQTHPDDLVAVRNSNTPVLSSPVEGAQLVLRADRGDEFQIIELKGAWVHVRISGLSRGWIQRSQLELPTLDATPSQPSDISQLTETSFRKTREEVSTFPGTWEPLHGKKVKIIWVQPLGAPGQDSKFAYAKSLFHQSYAEVSQREPDVSGVVIIFDSQDGGMAAATLPDIQQWAAGHLSDNAFFKRCWLDPPDTLKVKE